MKPIPKIVLFTHFYQITQYLHYYRTKYKLNQNPTEKLIIFLCAKNEKQILSMIDRDREYRRYVASPGDIFRNNNCVTNEQTLDDQTTEQKSNKISENCDILFDKYSFFFLLLSISAEKMLIKKNSGSGRYLILLLTLLHTHKSFIESH